jgi:hypothetical protein
MNLPVKPQPQDDPVWCWAAVASMVCNYYAQLGKGTAQSQCQVASATLKLPCCPSPPPPDPCRNPEDLRLALLVSGHLNQTYQPSSDFSVVTDELDAGRPLCAFYHYYLGADHYLLITGYDGPSKQVAVIDPATGVLSSGPYDDFLQNNSGYWDSWIFTQ